jgi:hypothetical protein
MPDQKMMEPFETRVADLVRAYTDPADARPVDALAVSRAAMAPGRATGWSTRRLGAGVLGRRNDGGRWAAAAVAVVLVSVVGVAVLSRPSDSGIGPQATPSASSAPSPAASAIGPVPEVLRHLWQRPLPIAPGPAWPTAFLVLTDEVLGVGPDVDSASHSAVAAAGLDTLVVTATPDTVGCAVGDLGVYRFSMEGKDTFTTLTAVGTDACVAREAALAGPWAQADLPPPQDSELLSPGTYETTGFDPFTDDATPGRLSYTVPTGWKVKEDASTAFVLHHLPTLQAQPATDTFIFMIAQPRLAAAFEDGAVCGEFPVASGVGHGADDIVAALSARPGVVSTPPAPVSVGGYEGTLIDLRLDPAWTGGCTAPDGAVVGIPILTGPGGGPGPLVGLAPNAPVRLILVDVGAGRTMAIFVACAEPSTLAFFDAQVATAMPVIESLELHPPTP